MVGMASRLNPADEYLLGEIELTSEALARWQRRGAQLPPEAPQLGSELDVDAIIFPPFPPWRMALISLLAAGEHLMIVRDTLAQRQLYTSGSYTVIRGALVGASQAVWALAPRRSRLAQRPWTDPDQGDAHTAHPSPRGP
jgi:hypothetical protein